MGKMRLRGPAQGPALIGVSAVAGLAAVLRASQPLLSGTDPFWHWDMGRRILEQGLVTRDPYSFLTAEQSWVPNQWGTEAIIGAARALGGPWLVAVLAALLVGGAMLLTGWLMWRRSPSLLTLAVFGGAVAAGASNWSLRGNLLTFLLLPLLLWELEREDGARPLVLLGLIAVWANVHAAFLLGVGLTIVFELGRLVVRTEPGGTSGLRRPALRIAAVCAGGILTPFGPRFLVGALELSVRGAQGAGLTEWAPTPITHPVTLPFTALIAAVLIAVALAATRADLPDVLLVVAGTLFGISAVRNVAAAAIVVGVVGAPYVRRAYVIIRDRPLSDVSNRPGRIDRGLARAVLGLSLLAVLGVVPRSDRIDAHVDDVPLELIRAIDELDRPARVVTVTQWAPAVSALTKDEVKTSVDGRLELFTPEQFSQQRTVESADPGWDDILEAWCVTDVLLPRENALAERLKRMPAWELQKTHETDAVWWTHHRRRRFFVPSDVQC